MLKNGDHGNGYIELSELVEYVQDQVPKVAAKMNGRGAAVAAADEHQSVQIGSRSENFALVRRLQ